jgi:hypothetical protein
MAKASSQPAVNVAREAEAKKRFEMISPWEANIRIAIGCVLICIGAPLALTATPPDEGGLAWLFITAGVQLVRMGQLSQCGCIMAGKWNPDGICYRPAPKSFANLKRTEFLLTIAQSVLMGFMVTLSLQLTEIIHIGPLPLIDLDLILSTCLLYIKWMVPSILITLVGSYSMHIR